MPEALATTGEGALSPFFLLSTKGLYQGDLTVETYPELEAAFARDRQRQQQLSN